MTYENVSLRLRALVPIKSEIPPKDESAVAAVHSGRFGALQSGS